MAYDEKVLELYHRISKNEQELNDILTIDDGNTNIKDLDLQLVEKLEWKPEKEGTFTFYINGNTYIVNIDSNIFDFKHYYPGNLNSDTVIKDASKDIDLILDSKELTSESSFNENIGFDANKTAAESNDNLTVPSDEWTFLIRVILQNSSGSNTNEVIEPISTGNTIEWYEDSEPGPSWRLRSDKNRVFAEENVSSAENSTRIITARLDKDENGSLRIYDKNKSVISSGSETGVEFELDQMTGLVVGDNDARNRPFNGIIDPNLFWYTKWLSDEEIDAVVDKYF